MTRPTPLGILHEAIRSTSHYAKRSNTRVTTGVIRAGQGYTIRVWYGSDKHWMHPFYVSMKFYYRIPLINGAFYTGHPSNAPMFLFEWKEILVHESLLH